MFNKFKIPSIYLLIATIFIHHFNLLALRPIDKELMIAAYNNDIQKVTDLLKEGADPNLTEKSGKNPLMIACVFGHTIIASLLVKKTTNINAQTPFGNTALLNALVHNQPDIAILLLNNGADPNIANMYGYTALNLARRKNYNDIIPLIHLYRPLTPQALQDKSSLFVLKLKEAISQYYQKDTALLEQIVTTPNASIQADLKKFINPKLLATLYQQFDQPKYLTLDEEKQRENLEKIEAEDYKRIMENKQF